MKDSDTISVAIPTYGRFSWLKESFFHIRDDPRIREIIISDDCSKDGSFAQMTAAFAGHSKVVVHQNRRNVDCYRNKKQAVELATSSWVILLDDDNVIKGDYLDVLFRLQHWEPNVIYCPDWAQPHFNYTSFSGQFIDRRNVSRLMLALHFKTALNTGNYFVHRESYLKAWDGSVDPITADSMFHAFNWLKRGGLMYITPGLRYFHRVHEGSHFKRHFRRARDFTTRLELQLRSLR
jgi:glycosyltransferase involved in cell wall biosynthesis